MATFQFVLFALAIVVATCGAAPENKKFSLKVPDECKGKGFCSIKPEGYDEMEDIINSLLPSHLITQNMGDRFGDGTQGPELSPESDWHNCPYRKTVQPAYTFTHEDNVTTDFIIQTNLFYQPIEIVTCAQDKIPNFGTGPEECFQHLSLSSFNMKTTCQTSTATRRLLVFDSDTRQIKLKNYEVPCCCTCKITSSM